MLNLLAAGIDPDELTIEEQMLIDLHLRRTGSAVYDGATA